MALMVAAAESSAQTANPPAEGQAVAPTDPVVPGDDILITAVPAERTTIDATTYVVRNNAEARASNALDLFARIPSIKVLPSGEILLLSRSDVRILIDGKEVAAPTELLRNMQASQIARIEVVTNPSARFSAQGTAGVINVITRRSFASGLGGSLTAKAGSFSTYDLRASPTWTRDKLSLSGGLGVVRTADPIDLERDRRRLDTDGRPVTELVERGTTKAVAQTFTANALVAYQLRPKQNLSLNAVAVESDGSSSRRVDLLPSGEEPSLLTASGSLRSSLRDLAGDYRREGKRPGEMLAVSGRLSTSLIRTDSAFAITTPANPSRLGFEAETFNRITALNIDYMRPLKASRRLLFGGAIQRTFERRFVRQVGEVGLRGDPISISTEIRGSWFDKALYASYQFPLLGGTVLAGLRIEDRRFDLADIPTPLGGTNLFPSLHLERNLAKGLKAGASYSRRIAWPSIPDLDPTLRFLDPTTASAGNPFLRPEITDSFEIKAETQILKQNFDLTAYARKTRNLVSVLSQLDDGVLLSRPVNLGSRDSRGLSLSVRGSFAKGFTYLLNGDLIDDRIDRPADSGFEPLGARVNASAQIEYRDGVEGRRHSDRVEARVRYDGGVEQGLVQISSYFDVYASWSHAITDRLSGVLTISDPFGPPAIRTTYFSPGTVSVQEDRRHGPRVSVAFTRTLGPLPGR